MKLIGYRFGIYTYSGRKYFIHDDFGTLVKSHNGALIHFTHYNQEL